MQLGVKIVFNEEEPDGTFCSECGHLIITKMHRLYLSVENGSELGFELLSGKIKLCEPCKIEYESHSTT